MTVRSDQWRASSKWQHGVHSPTSIQNYFGLGAEQNHKSERTFEADHPETFAASDNGVTPIEYLLVGLTSCLTAGVASVASPAAAASPPRFEAPRFEASRLHGGPRLCLSLALSGAMA